MRAPAAPRACRAGAALAALLAVAAPAGAQPAPPAGRPVPPDTALTHFVGQLADSTDLYFGLSAAAPDTAGLDSVLSDSAVRGGQRLDHDLVPYFRFDRAEGSTFGARLGLEGLGLGSPRTGRGRLEGEAAWAMGADRGFGGARYRNRFGSAGRHVDVTLFAGRDLGHMNRDESERLLATLRALLAGTDAGHYYRRDGFAGSLGHDQALWYGSLGYRHMLESPLPTTATWNLFGRTPVVIPNLPAARGRAAELDYQVGLRAPRVPLHAELDYATASRRLGGDFEYRRWRGALGLDLPLGHVATLVPQASYARLTGDAVPQASLYAGESSTLRSLRRDALGGTGLAVAKLDLLGARDLLQSLHLPHSETLPVQGAAFVSAAALWGRDPYTGTVVGGGDWPERRLWRSEAGISLLYSSALFERASFLRLSCAWPLGPGSGAPRLSVAVTRPLDLLSPRAWRQE